MSRQTAATSTIQISEKPPILMLAMELGEVRQRTRSADTLRNCPNMSGLLQSMPRPSKRLRVAPQVTRAEIHELKQRAAADGRSVAEFVAQLIVKDYRSSPSVFAPDFHATPPTEA